MAIQNYIETRSAGIDHLLGQLEYDPNHAIGLLNSGLGSREGCLGNLASFAKTKSLLAWFVDGDLHVHKRWAYVAAKLYRMIFQIEPGEWFPAYKHLYALLGDHRDMVN